MRTLEERFWPKVGIAGPDDCWEWQASCTKNGYGQIRPKSGAPPWGTHRVAFLLTYGDPGMLWVLHRCDNRKCCNPAHLFLGTVADNNADMFAKGRGRAGRGSGGPGAPVEVLRERFRKLTDDDIREARREHAMGVSCRSIARRIGVHHTQISRLIKGDQWKGYLVEAVVDD